jgi:adenylate kinase family enzyme
MYGEPGVGKTTLVYRVCRQEGFAVKEFNASHTRTGSAFRQQILPLLEEPGITSWMSSRYSRGHVVLLDEMDGMSSGERGGLQELLKYIRQMKKQKIITPLICCCNIIQGRKAQQLLRLSTVFEVKMPAPELLGSWLGRTIEEDERGSDLRQLLRGEKHALEEEAENEEELTIAKQIAHHTLFEEMDIYEEIVAETKKGAALAKQLDDIEDRERDLIKMRAKANLEINKARIIADDETKSYEDKANGINKVIRQFLI